MKGEQAAQCNTRPPRTHSHPLRSSSTARITTTRYIRPRFFPLFTFAVPKVKTTLKFNTDSDAAQGPGQDSDQPTKGLLYVTSFEDAWPLDSTIRSLPLAGKL